MFLKTRIAEQKLGWVVDFCPICREPRICQLSRFNEVKHFYLIPVGEPTPLEDEIRCSQCKTRQEVISTRYLDALPMRPTDLAKAAAATLPDLPMRLGGRLDLEKRVRDDYRALSPDERELLLFEPFKILNWHFERTVTNGHFDKEGATGCIGTLLLGALTIPVLIYTPQAKQQDVLKIAAALIGFGFLYTLVRMALSVGRVMRQTVFPNLVKALKPLRPDGQELQAILQRCEMKDFRLAKHVKVPKLMEALQ